jgi:hypothetical protein
MTRAEKLAAARRYVLDNRGKLGSILPPPSGGEKAECTSDDCWLHAPKPAVEKKP